jgi:NAD/NADP transhydrogenase alpha subunit
MDMIITTVLVPGAEAPKLVSTEMVESMKPGSVIVDLAAESGGNCELTEPGETVEHENVKVVGWSTCRAGSPSTPASCTRATCTT